MKNFIKLLLVGALLLNTGLLSAAESPFIIRGIRSLGMGGAHVALSDDENAFFYNPAGVTARKKGRFSFFEMRMSISQDVFDFSDWIDKNKDDLEKFDELDSARQEELMDEIASTISKYKNRFIVSALNMNYLSGPIGNTFFGIGIFDQADIGVKINTGLLVPNIDVWGNIDVAGMFLLAHKFNNVSLGLNLKLLGRTSLREDRISVLAFDGLDTPLPQPGFGTGVDLGLMWDIKENLKFGVDVTDFGGTVINYDEVSEEREQDDGTYETVTKEERSDIIYSRVNLGLAYKPLKEWFDKFFVPDVTLAIDVRDITDVEGDGKIEFSKILKKTHIGAEFAWSLLALRAGINSGYPCVGVGFYLWFLKFDYAFYTDELGMYPGEYPESNHTLSVAFRF